MAFKKKLLSQIWEKNKKTQDCQNEVLLIYSNDFIQVQLLILLILTLQILLQYMIEILIIANRLMASYIIKLLKCYTYKEDLYKLPLQACARGGEAVTSLSIQNALCF